MFSLWYKKSALQFHSDFPGVVVMGTVIDNENPPVTKNVNDASVPSSQNVSVGSKLASDSKNEEVHEGRVFWSNSLDFLMSLVAFAVGLGLFLHICIWIYEAMKYEIS